MTSCAYARTMPFPPRADEPFHPVDHSIYGGYKLPMTGRDIDHWFLFKIAICHHLGDSAPEGDRARFSQDYVVTQVTAEIEGTCAYHIAKRQAPTRIFGLFSWGSEEEVGLAVVTIADKAPNPYERLKYRAL